MEHPPPSVFRPLPSWVQLSPEKCYNESEQRRGCVQESPYWNPRHETMPRDQIEALQIRKLKNLVAWAEVRVSWQAKRLKAAGLSAESIQSLKDLSRIPMITRDEWMQAPLEDPPFGPVIAALQEAAIR